MFFVFYQILANLSLTASLAVVTDWVHLAIRRGAKASASSRRQAPAPLLWPPQIMQILQLLEIRPFVEHAGMAR
jgi:hypothetical protein